MMRFAVGCLCPLFLLVGEATSASSHSPGWLSPNALVFAPDGRTLFISCFTGERVAVFNVNEGTITDSIEVPPNPTGLAVSADGKRLWVTCGNPAGVVAVVDTSSRQVIDRLPAGHTPGAPVLSPDGLTLYVCNRFDNDVSFLDLAARKEICRVKVQREPVAAAVTRDGKIVCWGKASGGRLGRFGS